MRPYFFRKFGLPLMPLYVLLAYILMTQGALAGIVLCFGADSHLKVETAHARGPDNRSAKDHQGPCLDIPLTGSWVASEKSPLPADTNPRSQVREPITFLLFLLPLSPAKNVPQQVFPRIESISSLPTAFSRSTILLI